MHTPIIVRAAALAVLISRCFAAAGQPSLPTLSAILADSVDISDNGRPVKLLPGNRWGNWTLMAVANHGARKPVAVFEDFSTLRGSLMFVDAKGNQEQFPKSLEPTFAEPSSLYHGHTLKEVLNSDHDLLARIFHTASSFNVRRGIEEQNLGGERSFCRPAAEPSAKAG